MSFHNPALPHVTGVQLYVKNLEQSCAFYREKIGFQTLPMSEHKAGLSTDGTTILVTLEELTEATPRNPRETGLYHIAYLLPNRLELARALRHYIHVQAPLDGAADHLVSEALYLTDPDGNGIEVYADRPSETWVWEGRQVAMSTNPLKVDELLEIAESSDLLPWSGLPEQTLLGHLHLQVAELEDVKQFYVDGLGFDIVSFFGHQALFISSGHYHHHIGLNTWNSRGAKASSETRLGLGSFTIHYQNEAVLKTALIRLTALGFSVIEKPDGIDVQDPSGNRIKLTVYHEN